MLIKWLSFLSLLLMLISCASKKAVKLETAAPAEADVYFTGTVIRNNINIRSASSTHGSILGVVNDGEQVRVMKNENGWYQIITSNNITGWVRSDFIGTKSLSYTIKAENFVDSTLKELNVQMFIDENNPYAVIYFLLPDDKYHNEDEAKRFANEVGQQYQEKVYPGSVEIRILKKDKKSIFEKVFLSKKGAVNLKAPFLKSGRPYSFDLINGNALIIKVLIPAGLSDDVLFQMSQDISANYGDDIRKVEIYFVEDNPEGEKYFVKNDYTPQDKSTCRFYFIEDSNGPDYKAYFCN